MNPTAATFHARDAFLPGPDGGGEFVPDVVVEVDAMGTLNAVRSPRPGDPPPLDGVLIPGLINAHLHLELSHLAGVVPGGHGLPLWVNTLMQRRGAVDEGAALPAMVRAAADLRASGTVAVCDIANGDDSAAILARAGLQGVVQHELLGMDARGVAARIAAALEPDGELIAEQGHLLIRPSPHAAYSTAPAVIRAAVLGRGGGDAERSVTETDRTLRWASRPPASIHCAEDPQEAAFLADGGGAWATLLDRMGLAWRWFQPPGVSPVAYLDQLGVLGPDLLLVHAVHLDPHDRAQIRDRGATVVLCPRSNLHIGGRLPDVAALRASQVPLALGTDSLASSPDLDVLGEVAVLVGEGMPPEAALFAATGGGADALRLPHLGRIAVDKAPGLVLLAIDRPEQLGQGAPARQIVASAGRPL